MPGILIIDDDEWYARSLANMLDSGSVEVANSAETAIEKIDENIPSMIYLDLELGTRNGLTVLNELQSWTDTRHIPIVLLSSDGKRLNIDDWRQYGVIQILDKTELTPEKIYYTINLIFQGQSLENLDGLEGLTGLLPQPQLEKLELGRNDGSVDQGKGGGDA